MEQLVQPNLDTVGNIGWCLSFVENVFGTPHIGDTATDGWYSCQTQHKDTDFPDAYVPVWFSYFEGGVNYGHVAVHAPDGRVLSSPYAQENTHVWFSSIDQCAQVLNCTYLGWSEDLAGVQIVKEINMFQDTNDVRVNGFGLFGIDLAGDDPALQAWVGKSKLDFYVGLGPQVINNTNTLKAALASLQKEYDDLKAAKAQEKATPDVPPAPVAVPVATPVATPVVINDPLPPTPSAPPNLPSGLSVPLKVAIGAVIALLIALTAWLR